jgi:hypothetical protein
MVKLQLLNFWLLKIMLQGKRDGVVVSKPGHLMVRNTQHGQMIHPSCCYPINWVYVWRTPKGACNPEYLFPSVKHGRVCVMI